MIEICKKFDIPVILVGRTEKNVDNENFESQRVISINDVIKKYSTLKNIYYFDTPQIMYKNYPKREDKQLLFTDDTHWTALGHRFIAEQLIGNIVKALQATDKL